MKTKNLAKILILFLFIASAGAVVMYLTNNQTAPAQIALLENSANESAIRKAGDESSPALAESGGSAAEEKAAGLEVRIDKPTEGISVSLIIIGARYEVKGFSGSSVYDLMNKLKQEKKIDFQGRDYAGLGFFVEAINGVKNNPADENWIYYVNGRPAPVGASNYKVKVNDVIEWRYEKRLF